MNKMLDRTSQVKAVVGWTRVGVTAQERADWNRGPGCFLVAGSDAFRGPRLRSRTQEEGRRGEMSDKCQVYKPERRAPAKAQCSEG